MGSGFLLRRIRTAFLSPNNRSVFRHSELVTKAIGGLLAYGCIVEHSVPPFCVNLLTVAEGEKLRSVTDLRPVSNYLVKFRLKFEDLRFLFQVLEEGHWFLHGTLNRGITKWTSVQSIKRFLALLGRSVACSNISPFQFCLSALVALAIVSPNCCALLWSTGVPRGILFCASWPRFCKSTR